MWKVGTYKQPILNKEQNSVIGYEEIVIRTNDGSVVVCDHDSSEDFLKHITVSPSTKPKRNKEFNDEYSFNLALKIAEFLNENNL